jgi:periplasmic protein TonB
MPHTDRVTYLARPQRWWLTVSILLVAVGLATVPKFADATEAAVAGTAPADVAKVDADQRRLLRELRESLANFPALPTPSPDDSSDIRETRARKAQMLRVVAELERRINARSLGHEVGPPKEASIQYRAYYDRLRMRIEREAAQAPPMQGGVPLYGRLTLVLTIGSDGSIKSMDAEDPSSEEFRQYTLQLVRRLAPFETFPAAVTKTADDVVITTTIEHAR